jgi:NAD(P)-dependent dehydrogenase (short-subunit alcohol dehydrogenase family)
MPSIKNQSILVIGGSSGIGFAVAQLAIEQGVHVSIASSNSTRVASAIERLRSTSQSPDIKINGHIIDLNTLDVEDSLQNLFSAVTKTGSEPLDHIIYTAVAPITLLPLSEHTSKTLASNVQMGMVVPFLIGKVAPSFLEPSFNSSITFTSGQIADKPMEGYTVMSGYAIALYGITRGLAVDLKPIRVNCVSPGPTVTELWGSPESREQRAQFMAKMTLLGKVAKPEEVAEAYIYLLRNPDATGSVVASNGGITLK